MTTIKGELEIDHERGVLYFHSYEPPLIGTTVLRICRLPRPIPKIKSDFAIDITHMIGQNWTKGGE
uniref:Uncharacterized protein n=1 Tax=viral metagenome TaxID=1070528 RepID=A0A6M3LU06_9ZZZZ